MSILGIISEYNPFHLGHKYHIEESKKKTNSNYVVSVMSGSFVQRGEPAFLDKWSRAEMAINGGVDLIIELPTIYSTQTAELFSFGGIKLLDSLNIVDYVSFGTETGDLKDLNIISSILADEPNRFKIILKSYLNKGLSYPIARGKALETYLNNNIDVLNIVNKANNILAIEYLKAIKRLNSKIKPYTIKRIGEDYSSKKLGREFSSATGIRENIIKNGIYSTKNYLPDYSFSTLNEFQRKHNSFNSISNYEDILLYLLRTNYNNINALIGTDNGLGNRILNNANNFNTLDEIIENSISKIHTRTRIQRVLTHLLLNLTSENFKEMEEFFPNYIRVLAANRKGLELLNKIKDNSKLPIITKFSNFNRLNSKKIDEIISFDKKSTDIFYLGLSGKSNMDFLTSPYIKK